MKGEPNLIVIGVSTGGPMTLKQIFADRRPLEAAVVVVLHIAPGMDRLIARGLAAVSSMPVSLAKHGEPLEKGHIYLSPGGFHLTLDGNRRIVLSEGARVNYVQPSADVAMKSIMKPKHAVVIGVILTGMGKDGADGIRHIKSIGGITIAQNKETSAIFGMPKAAAQTGAVDFVLPKERIWKKLAELLKASSPQ
jgi:two-component system chemotaxis response regulator CheB